MSNYSVFQKSNCFIKYHNVKSSHLYGKKQNECFISIIIPTYNRFKLLIEAIKSASSQNSNVKYEIIIVDNTDNDSYLLTLDWLKKNGNSKINYYHNESNIGMFGNWNRGIELSSGKWIVILNDDDLLDINYVSVMVETINKLSENVAIIGCNHYNLIHGKIEIQKKHFVKDKIKKYFVDGYAIKVLPKDLYFGANLCLVGAMISRDFAITVGGFREDYYPTSDYVFMIDTAFNDGAMYLLESKLAYYRIEENESMKYSTIELFMIHQNEAKKSINGKMQYLPCEIAEYFRRVSLLIYEERLAQTWLYGDEEKKEKLLVLNEKLKLTNVTYADRLFFYCYEKIRLIWFVFFRKRVRRF